MARSKVIWTSFAKADFQETLDFYSKRNQNKIYSKKLLQRVRVLIQLLVRQPQLGAATEFEAVRAIGTSPFRIYYKVEEKRLVILLVWDARRNPEDLKEIISAQA